MRTDLLDTVRALKTKAKNRRDDSLYEAGVELAEQAIALLQEEFDAATTDGVRSELAAELADCHGLIGGIQRRWGLGLADAGRSGERTKHLEASVDAYARGHEYELENNYGVVNSYNLVNRLVGRILLEPEADLKTEMTEAKTIVAEQLMQKRRGDIWALADLALLRLLLCEVDADAAWREFRVKGPPYYAYESVLDTLEPLVALDLPCKEELERSATLLGEDLDEL